MEQPRAKLEAAKTATEFFGPLPATPATKRAAKRTYRILAVELHPDKNPDGEELFKKLQGFYDTWSEGKTAAAPARTQVQAGPWTVGDLVAKGSISNLYRAVSIAAKLEGVVKLARKPSSNGFLQAEATALEVLGSGALYPEEMLTSLLKTVTPEYEDCAPAIPNEIDGVPVAITSTGPNRLDRVALPALA